MRAEREGAILGAETYYQALRVHVTILGKRWKLRWVGKLPKTKDGRDTRGDCSPPDSPKKEIRILKGLDEKTELDSILHEALHAADWHKAEEWVEEVATDLAEILWKLGYRKTLDR